MKCQQDCKQIVDDLYFLFDYQFVKGCSLSDIKHEQFGLNKSSKRAMFKVFAKNDLIMILIPTIYTMTKNFLAIYFIFVFYYFTNIVKKRLDLQIFFRSLQTSFIKKITSNKKKAQHLIKYNCYKSVLEKKLAEFFKQQPKQVDKS
ncbi:hypothetical protein RFI_04942 [Reticulomyxa filosa]|uniref:Transmembrane protein n=1 Tax=Reticulomyxa filosa TaxID=46433 RepID=X6P0T2_RETFI|nr:hypothetical protein RFI_04942 [Reticulomyxa filosa]|eukprot:ETO32175.1 hypothetical protein RFI_04942 [Reticulomyxa filosa]